MAGVAFIQPRASFGSLDFNTSTPVLDGIDSVVDIADKVFSRRAKIVDDNQVNKIAQDTNKVSKLVQSGMTDFTGYDTGAADMSEINRQILAKNAAAEVNAQNERMYDAETVRIQQAYDAEQAAKERAATIAELTATHRTKVLEGQHKVEASKIKTDDLTQKKTQKILDEADEAKYIKTVGSMLAGTLNDPASVGVFKSIINSSNVKELRTLLNTAFPNQGLLTANPRVLESIRIKATELSKTKSAQALAAVPATLASMNDGLHADLAKAGAYMDSVKLDGLTTATANSMLSTSRGTNKGFWDTSGQWGQSAMNGTAQAWRSDKEVLLDKMERAVANDQETLDEGEVVPVGSESKLKAENDLRARITSKNEKIAILKSQIEGNVGEGYRQKVNQQAQDIANIASQTDSAAATLSVLVPLLPKQKYDKNDKPIKLKLTPEQKKIKKLVDGIMKAREERDLKIKTITNN